MKSNNINLENKILPKEHPVVCYCEVENLFGVEILVNCTILSKDIVKWDQSVVVLDS